MSDALVHREQAIEPDLPIIDPHHHVWDDLTLPVATLYPTDRLLRDLNGGHRIVATVYAECTSHWRQDGPEEFRPVGETEWITRQELPSGVMAGIIGYADLQVGARAARPVLDAHLDAAGGRFRGIRHSTAWDASRAVPNTVRMVPPGTLTSDAFIDSARLLGQLGLTLDTWIYAPQMPELIELAQAVPEVDIVLDHLGAPLAVGPYATKRKETLAEWRRNLREVAKQKNVSLKIGGLGFHLLLAEGDRDRVKSSTALASHWQTEVDFAIDTFGPSRCMFESNFPVDSYAVDYVTLWNAFKKMSAAYSPQERAALFHGTAARVYDLEQFVPTPD